VAYERTDVGQPDMTEDYSSTRWWDASGDDLINWADVNADD